MSNIYQTPPGMGEKHPKYPKIPTLFSRDVETNYKHVIVGQFSTPELAALALTQWVFTEKLDGTNIRVGYHNGEVQFGGRTDKAQLPAPLAEYLLHTFPRDAFDTVFGPIDKPVTLYGEGVGQGIQKVGGIYGQRQHFVLFDVRVGDLWLEYDNVLAVAGELGVWAAPVVGTGDLWGMLQAVRQREVTSVHAEMYNSTAADAEGIIARPAVTLLDRMGNRIITKLKLRDFVQTTGGGG
jgi:hypothetical protein